MATDGGWGRLQRRILRETVCRFRGHHFDVYGVYAAPYFETGSVIETAGHCRRCGYDTHDDGPPKARHWPLIEPLRRRYYRWRFRRAMGLTGPF